MQTLSYMVRVKIAELPEPKRKLTGADIAQIVKLNGWQFIAQELRDFEREIWVILELKIAEPCSLHPSCSIVGSEPHAVPTIVS